MVADNGDVNMSLRDRLQVRVNEEVVLDAGTCEEVSGPHGPEWLIHPPETTLFHQVLAYLRDKPDPPKRPSGAMVGREGVAAAALVLRWGSYLAVLLDRPRLFNDALIVSLPGGRRSTRPGPAASRSATSRRRRSPGTPAVP